MELAVPMWKGLGVNPGESTLKNLGDKDTRWQPEQSKEQMVDAIQMSRLIYGFM